MAIPSGSFTEAKEALINAPVVALYSAIPGIAPLFLPKTDTKEMVALHRQAVESAKRYLDEVGIDHFSPVMT